VLESISESVRHDGVDAAANDAFARERPDMLLTAGLSGDTTS
jgi:hypothetical protein